MLYQLFPVFPQIPLINAKINCLINTYMFIIDALKVLPGEESA